MTIYSYWLILYWPRYSLSGTLFMLSDYYINNRCTNELLLYLIYLYITKTRTWSNDTLVNSLKCFTMTLAVIWWNLPKFCTGCKINTIYLHCREKYNILIFTGKQVRAVGYRLVSLSVSKEKKINAIFSWQYTYIIY